MRHELRRGDGSYELQESTGHAIIRYGVPALMAIAVGAMTYVGGAINIGSVGGRPGHRGGHKPGQSYSQPGQPTLTVVPGDTFANLSTNEFSGSPGDTHASTSWWITKESTPTDTVWSSLADADSLTSYRGAGASVPLATDSVYVAHVFHTGTYGGASPESVDTFTAAVTTYAFFDDFESGDLTHTENGFHWGASNGSNGAPHVWNTGVSRDGSYALVFRFGAVADLADCSAEQRFYMDSTNITEIWFQYYMYYPDGTESWSGSYGSAAFYHRSQTSGGSNNKFMRLWGTTQGDYGGGTTSNEVGFETQPNGSTAGDEDFVFKYVYNAHTSIGQYASPTVIPWVDDPNRGRWIQVRIHLKMSQGVQGDTIPYDGGHRSYGDGISRVWWDGTKVLDFDYWGVDSQKPYWSWGYLMGYANSGFTDETYVLIDDFEVFYSDPGWAGDS